jgi:hypothetical protein
MQAHSSRPVPRAGEVALVTLGRGFFDQDTRQGERGFTPVSGVQVGNRVGN